MGTRSHVGTPTRGIANAKAEGKYRGRKPTARTKAADVIRLACEGKTREAIAAQLGIGVASVYPHPGSSQSRRVAFRHATLEQGQGRLALWPLRAPDKRRIANQTQQGLMLRASPSQEETGDVHFRDVATGSRACLVPDDQATRS
jgi:hypothetical protein